MQTFVLKSDVSCAARAAASVAQLVLSVRAPMVNLSLSLPLAYRHYPSSPMNKKLGAIVYLVQERHSSYGRDSLALLSQSVALLFENYNTVQVFRNAKLANKLPTLKPYECALLF